MGQYQRTAIIIMDKDRRLRSASHFQFGEKLESVHHTTEHGSAAFETDRVWHLCCLDSYGNGREAKEFYALKDRSGLKLPIH